ncbi:MAG: TrkA C-terminal domain-containing protein [Calditrichaceae bacterium]|jgi:hypothetical protein
MIGIIGIIALLSVLTLSLVITRIATIALSLTGLSWEASRFQARSAVTGTGFTTSETEKVVNHPVRRKIIMMLMVLRSAGLMTIIISLIFSFANSAEDTEMLYRVLGLFMGILILLLLSRSKFIDNTLNKLIRKALKRWTKLEVRDYENMLKLSGNYSVTELEINEDDWLNGRKLKECRLGDEGINVLGIYRENGNYVGVPRGDTNIYEGDKLILYAREETLSDLNQRRKGGRGDRSHDKQVQEHEDQMEKQEKEEQNFEKEKKGK